LAAVLLLAACATDTTIRFRNQTECGTATINFTNTSTNKTTTYTVEEGKTVSIDISTEVQYTYTVDYAGRQGSQLKCESKSAAVVVHQKGETTIGLVSATPTPEPAQ
jgi:2',3'-cyclic-nucleotide 2'-phosphodiesterase (5'-nucleotidase family)